MRSVGIVALLLAAAAAPAVLAACEDGCGLPLLASGASEGPTWLAFRVHTDGSLVYASLQHARTSFDFAGAAYVYDASGALLTAPGVQSGVWTDRVGWRAQADLDPAPPARASSDDLEPVAPMPRLGSGTVAGGPFVVLNDPTFAPSMVGDGEFTIVMMIATEQPLVGTSWRVQGGEGVSLRALSNGDGVHFLKGRDLAGAATVHATAGPPAARAQLAARADLAAEHRLVGAVMNHAQALVRLDTPAGERPCADTRPFELSHGTLLSATLGTPTGHCLLHEIQGGRALGPGAYTLHVTGAGAHTQDVVVLLADVALP